MTVLSAEHIETFLSDYGWDFTPQNNNSWMTGWEGTVGSYPLNIVLQDTLVSFVVRPLIDDVTAFEESPELVADILKLNHDLKLVRLSLDENGDICLCFDSFQEALSFESFSNILGVLGYYSDVLTSEITELVTLHGVDSRRPTLC